jgi:hypothetical protein
MRLLIGECIDERLRLLFPGHDCPTARFANLAGLKNGRLPDAAAASGFDVLVTVDQNMPDQQNLVGRRISLIVLRGPANRLRDLESLVPSAFSALRSIRRGDVVKIGYGLRREPFIDIRVERVSKPALPKAWAEGSVTGLKARGGVEVDIVWRSGNDASATLRTALAGERHIRAPRGRRIAEVRSGGKKISLAPPVNETVKLAVKPGQVYRIAFA